MKYALITGCDHGLGLALASELLSRGYYTVACRLNPGEQQIDALCHSFPEQSEIHTLDISRDDSVTQLKEDTGHLPCLDLLINCAGILGVMENSPEEPLDFDRMLSVINVNAVGTLRVTSALLPLVEKSQDKTILNISSEAGSIQDCWRKGWFGYCMSKSANNMQGTLIHNWLRSKGGQVIQMHPGHVATFMRGHLDLTATVTPAASAKGILKTVLDQSIPVRDIPLYLDYTGKELRY